MYDSNITKPEPKPKPIGCLRDNFGWVGSPVVCFLHFFNPNPRRKNTVGKKWPKCRFLPTFCSRVGLALGLASSIDFIILKSTILMFFSPSEFGRSQMPYFRGAIVFRTHDGLKKTYISLFLRTILGPDYYVPP